MKSTSGGAGCPSLSHCLWLAVALHRRAERATGQRKMADGVDHIDIYADVEEEFSQVLNSHSPHVD